MCVEEDSIADRAIASALGGGGLEAWRQILSRYDPEIMTTGFNKIDRLLNPDRCKHLKDVIPSIDSWESSIRQLRTEEHRKMFENDTLKHFTVRKIVTSDLEAHLKMFGQTANTYPKAIAEINRYIEEHSKGNKDKPVPMQVDGLDGNGGTDADREERIEEYEDVNALGGKKGGGKGKGGKEQHKGPWVEKRYCWICGQQGHIGRDCPNQHPYGGKTSNNGKGGGLGYGASNGFTKGKGKTGFTGKGQGFGKGLSNSLGPTGVQRFIQRRGLEQL